MQPYPQPPQYPQPPMQQPYYPQPPAQQYAPQPAAVPQQVSAATRAAESSGDFVRIKDLGPGRLVLIIPTLLTENLPSKYPDASGKPKLQSRVTADVIVLDGEPYAFGGKPDDEFAPVPHTHQVAPVARHRGCYLSGAPLVGQLRKAVPTTAGGLSEGQGMIYGRIEKRRPAQPGGRASWVIADNPSPEDGATAQAWLDRMRAAQDVYSEPTLMQYAPAMPMPNAYYTPAAQEAWQQATQQPNYGPAPAQQPWPIQQPPQGWPQPVAQQPAPYLAGQAQTYAPGPAPQQQAQQGPQRPDAVPADFWTTLSPEQQAQMVASMAPQQRPPY